MRGQAKPNAHTTAETLDPAKRAQLPQDIDAEQSVLAACMLNTEVVEELVLRLRPENFFRPAHRIIFESIYDLSVRRIPVDPIALSDTLQSKGQLEAIGGRAYLAELADNTFALTNWQRHAEIVKRTAILRELVYAAADINALAYDAPDDLNQVVEEAEKMLFNVTEKRVSSTFTKMDVLLTGGVRGHHAPVRAAEPHGGRADRLQATPTTCSMVSEAAIWSSSPHVPGVGKTSFALNLAINAAKSGAAVAFFSLEMSGAQLVQRILCAEARVSLSKIRGGFVSEGDWGALAEAMNSLSKLELYIDDSPTVHPRSPRKGSPRASPRLGRRQRPHHRGLFAAHAASRDPKRRKPRRRGRRDLAWPEGACQGDGHAGHRAVPAFPRRRDARQEAPDAFRPSRVWLDRARRRHRHVHRPLDGRDGGRKRRPPDLGTAELIVAKHRNGPTKDITLAFNPEYTKFMDFIDDSRVGGY